MKHIAIVDDSMSTAALLAGYLRQLSETDTTIFSCARSALTWCRHAPLDLVIVDYRMPDVDGLRFVRELRAAEHLRSLPVIMVTADERKDPLYEALSLGAIDYLRKPVDRHELLARARNMISLRVREQELTAANARLVEQVNADFLTGLANRRAFMGRLESLLAPDARPGALMIVDIDNFKGINDTYGHEAGDLALIATAGTIGAFASTDKFAARIGGEEFALLCPATDLETALDFGHTLLARVRGLGLDAGGGRVSVSVSIGLTALLPGLDTPRDAMKRADMALYRAKTLGRNRLEVSDAFDLPATFCSAAGDRRRYRSG